MLADKCLELAEKNDESSDSEGYTRAVAVKGLVELVHGNLGISKDVAKGTLCLFFFSLTFSLTSYYMTESQDIN